MTFNFGQRKIQKIRYSFMIPLQVDWIKNLNIGDLDSLKIEMQDDQSSRMTPVPQAHQDSKGTREPTPDYEKRCKQ